MKISIVTPSYNQARFLEKALLSVWEQQGDFDLEHIIADGGSTDGSVELLQKYEHLFRRGQFNYSCRSFTFRWWSRKDKGQSDAINKAFDDSSGDLIGWLNSDDTYIDENSLSVLSDQFKFVHTDIVVGNGHHIDQEGARLDIPLLINNLDNKKFQQRLYTLPRYNFILQPATLFKRNVWESCKIDTQYHYVMDWVFWIEAQRKGFRFFKVDAFTATNRLHGEAKTVEGGIEKYSEGLALYKRYNIWCFNRLYYYLYLMFLEGEKMPVVGKLLSSFVVKAKKIRILLINRFKLY